jgi:hypothetical protein
MIKIEGRADHILELVVKQLDDEATSLHHNHQEAALALQHVAKTLRIVIDEIKDL